MTGVPGALDAPIARVAPVAGNRATPSPLSHDGSSFTVTVQEGLPR